MRFNPYAPAEVKPESSPPRSASPRCEKRLRKETLKPASPARAAFEKVPDATVLHLAGSDLSLDRRQLRAVFTAWLEAHPGCRDWRDGWAQHQGHAAPIERSLAVKFSGESPPQPIPVVSNPEEIAARKARWLARISRKKLQPQQTGLRAENGIH